MNTVTRLKYEDKFQFFDDLSESWDDSGRINLCFRRLNTSRGVMQEFNKKDIAALAHLYRYFRTQPALDDASVKNDLNSYKLSQKELAEVYLESEEEQGDEDEDYASIYSADEYIKYINAKERERLELKKLLPRYSALIDTGWWWGIASTSTLIAEVFNNDDPFEMLNDFFSEQVSLFNQYPAPCFLNIEKEIISETIRDALEALDKEKHKVFIKIASIAIEDRDKKDIDIEEVLDYIAAEYYYDNQDEKVNTFILGKWISPDLQLIADLFFSFDCVEYDSSNSLLNHIKFYSILIDIIGNVRVNDTQLATWDIREYLTLRHKYPMHFIPTIDTFLEAAKESITSSIIASHVSGDVIDHQLPDILERLVDELAQLTVKQNFRGMSFSLVQLSGISYSDNLSEELVLLKNILSTFFLAGDRDFDLRWNDVKFVISSLTRKAQLLLADAILASTLYYIFIVKRSPILDGIFFSDPDIVRLLNRPYTKRLLCFLRDLARSDDVLSALWHPLLENIKIDSSSLSKAKADILSLLEGSYDPEKAQMYLREMLSDEVWENLTEYQKGDLIKSESSYRELVRQQEIERVEPNRGLPERAYFSHIGAVLEGELKSALQPLFEKLEKWFNENPVDKKNPLWMLQGMATKEQHRTLGPMVNLLAERRQNNKLGKFPELLEAVENSGLIRDVFKERGLREALRAIPSDYRNPASHHSPDKVLGIDQVMGLRGLLYNQRLLSKLVLSRVNDPIVLDPGNDQRDR